MCYKAPETTHNINNAFGPGTANEHTMQCGSSLAKETRALKMRSTVAGHRWLTIPIEREKLTKNSTLTILQSFSTWCKLERWKSSVNGCCVSWPKFLKIVVLKCYLLLFYATTMNHFLIGLWHATESGFYTTIAKPLSDWTKKLQSTSQSQTCTIKRLWSLFGGLQTVWSTIAFWILAKPLPLRSMLSRSMRCTKTATLAASIGQQKGPNSSPQQHPTTHHTTNASKVELIGLRSSASFTIDLTSHQLTTISFISTTFWREDASTTSCCCCCC